MRNLLFFLIFFSLIGLGTWQLIRLKEKQNLVSGIQKQILLPVEGYYSDNLSEYKYRKVRFIGKILPEKAIFYYRLNNNVPGYELLVPTILNNGKCLLIDLGWQEQQDLHELSEQEIILEGVVADLYRPAIMHPDNDLSKNIWFDLNIETVENHLGVSCVPYLLVLYSPQDLIFGKNDFSIDLANIPNNHLSYAITWFFLACAWVVVMFIFYMKREK